MSKIRKIAAHYLFSGGELIPHGIVSLDDSGAVIGVRQAESLDSTAGVEFYDGIVIPGMVNAHCHLELSHMAGAMRPGGGYTAFAKGMGMFRAADGQTRQAAASYRDASMWRQGVQAVGDISNGTTTFGIKSRSDIHYHTFVEMFGFDDSRAADVVRVYTEARGAGLSASVTPHAPYSLSCRGFRLAVDATPGSPLSIHFMESRDEVELFDGCGDMARWYEQRGLQPDFLRYGSPADRIAEQVPQGRALMLVHNTQLTDRVAGRLAERFGRALTWTLCPQSNLFITGTLPPLDVIRRSGCNVAVGTDSMASNTDLSMAAEMRALQRAGATLAEVIEWSTLGGARALGLESRLGTFDVGKRPGVAILSGVDWQTMTLGESAATVRIA